MDESRMPSAWARQRTEPIDVASREPGAATRDLARALDRDLVGSLNVRRTALRVLDLARNRVADWAVLILDERRSHTLHCFGGSDARFSSSLKTAPTRSTVRRLLERGPLAIGQSAPDTLADLIVHPRLLHEARALPSGVVALPLHARGDVIGALVLGRSLPRPFSDADFTLAEQIADRAGLALDAGLIYEDHARVTRVLEDSLRPPALAGWDGLDVAAVFRPAAEDLDIGGDFYDVHGEEGDWLVVLGDVCGKGVEAAVLNGRARQTIRTAAHFDRQPGPILSVLNDVLCEEESDRFVTVVACRMRSLPGGGCTADLAVAGHPAPLVVRADGTVEQPEVQGRLSGVLEHDDPYREVRVHLAVGDALVLYTDGIYEAQGAGGDYGMDRLRRLVSRYAGTGVLALSEAIEQDVVDHLGGRGHDDITALVLAPRPPRAAE